MERPDVIPIPIRPDFVVKVHIPLDLTAEEAEKVARVVAAFASDVRRMNGGMPND